MNKNNVQPTNIKHHKHLNVYDKQWKLNIANK